MKIREINITSLKNIKHVLSNIFYVIGVPLAILIGLSFGIDKHLAITMLLIYATIFFILCISMFLIEILIDINITEE